MEVQCNDGGMKRINNNKMMCTWCAQWQGMWRIFLNMLYSIHILPWKHSIWFIPIDVGYYSLGAPINNAAFAFGIGVSCYRCIIWRLTILTRFTSAIFSNVELKAIFRSVKVKVNWAIASLSDDVFKWVVRRGRWHEMWWFVTRDCRGYVCRWRGDQMQVAGVTMMMLDDCLIKR